MFYTGVCYICSATQTQKIQNMEKPRITVFLAMYPHIAQKLLAEMVGLDLQWKPSVFDPSSFCGFRPSPTQKLFYVWPESKKWPPALAYLASMMLNADGYEFAVCTYSRELVHCLVEDAPEGVVRFIVSPSEDRLVEVLPSQLMEYISNGTDIFWNIDKF